MDGDRGMRGHRLSFRGIAPSRWGRGWPYRLTCAVRERVMHRHASRQTARLRRGLADLKEIEILSIEFASVCNLDCAYCFLHRDNGRPHYLDPAVYRKLIAEIAGNPAYGIKSMEWPISGDFFMNKRWREFIDITRRAMDEHPSFRPWVLLNDNMMLFTPDKIEVVLDSGVVHQIICSLDGRDKESAERMRPGARYETLLAHIHALVDANHARGNKVVIEINNGTDALCEDRPIDPAMQAVFDRVDRVRPWTPVIWNDSFTIEGKGGAAPKPGYCRFVTNVAALSTSGKLIKCCMDLQESTAYADFTASTLERLWRGPERLAFMEAMGRGKRSELPGCASCTIGWTDNDNTFRTKA